jgi:phage terminase small subunit
MGIAAERAAEAEAKGQPWTGGDGMTIPTPSGHVTYSPHWVIANKAAQQVQAFLAEFGLSPANRGKVSPSAVRQRALFDDDEGGEPAGYGAL